MGVDHLGTTTIGTEKESFVFDSQPPGAAEERDSGGRTMAVDDLGTS
jgi:hypothetical protein